MLNVCILENKTRQSVAHNFQMGCHKMSLCENYEVLRVEQNHKQKVVGYPFPYQLILGAHCLTNGLDAIRIKVIEHFQKGCNPAKIIYFFNEALDMICVFCRFRYKLHLFVSCENRSTASKI